MDDFRYLDGQLYVEQTSVDELAQAYGTPMYVYSANTLLTHYQKLHSAFASLDPLICYSIKSSGNIHLVRLLAEQGAGMDLVSGGELRRAIEAGVDPAKCFYAGVGKTDQEIRYALEQGIGYFNIESEAEFENIAAIAKELDVQAKAALRINPDVADDRTHAKTTTGKKETKFGVDIDRAGAFFQHYGHDSHLHLEAIHLHIGSPIYSAEPYARAIDKTLKFIEQLEEQGHRISAIDIGGGFAADYESDVSPSYEQYAAEIVPRLQAFHDRGGRVLLEPGRTLVANAGILLTQVQYVKTGGHKKFIIVDTGMHHLIRPTLYDAWQFLWPTNVAPSHVPDKRAKEMTQPGLETVDVVGPICETGDYLALDRSLPPVARGDMLAVFGSGAYGMVMASNYNTMPRPAEVLVTGSEHRLIRRRETFEDLLGPELDVAPATAS